MYQNYFKYVADHIKMNGGNDMEELADTIHRHMKDINRCFYANTLEEIIENLKRENTPFSKKCLE